MLGTYERNHVRGHSNGAERADPNHGNVNNLLTGGVGIVPTPP